MGHRTVARRAEHVDVVKGSRFVAVVASVADVAAGAELLRERRAADPDATHHAFALRIGDVQRSDDDGEPGGTAGRPMLEVLLRRDLDRVAAVVSRTFGGTKLGAGGLVRAYAGAVARALDAAGVAIVHDLVTLEARVAFADVDAVLRAAGAEEVVVRAASDFSHGDARVRAVVRADGTERWSRTVADLTRGGAEMRIVPAAAAGVNGG